MNDDAPPRGYQFAVAHESHVVDSPAHPVKVVVGSARYDSRIAANRAASGIDHRLTPVTITVAKEKS